MRSADGKIQAVVRDAAPELAATVVDASGCYVLPGIFDAHVHPIYADSMETLSVSAAHGGITTLIHFIGSGNFTAWGARPEWSLADSIEHFRGEGERTSYLDFAFHAAIAQADDHLKTIPAGVALGDRDRDVGAVGDGLDAGVLPGLLSYQGSGRIVERAPHRERHRGLACFGTLRGRMGRGACGAGNVGRRGGREPGSSRMVRRRCTARLAARPILGVDAGGIRLLA